MTIAEISIHSIGAVDDRADGESDVCEWDEGTLSLAMLLTRLRRDRPEVVTAPGGLDVMARSVVIWDGSTEVRIERGDILLAIGETAANDQDRLLTLAGRVGACAVVVKHSERLEWLATQAQIHGVALLSIPSAASWDRVYRRFNAVMGAGARDIGAAAGVLTGDLFALSESAARLLGGAVEIDDATMRPIAYCNDGADIDEVRRLSILERRPPEKTMAQLTRSGLLDRIRSARRPVLVDLPEAATRLVLPIRAGIEIIGYLWFLQGRTSAGDVRSDLMADVARIASDLIGRLHAINAEESASGRLLSVALDGEKDLEDLVSTIGTGPYRLVAFCARNPEIRPHPQQMSAFRNAVLLHAESTGYHVVAAEVCGSVYALFPDVDERDERIEQISGRIVAHANRHLRINLVASISGRFEQLRSLHAARAETDRIAVMLGSEGGSVGSADRLRPQVVLAELREMTRSRPHLMRGPLDAIAEMDSARGTDYLPTLRAYLAAQCDLAEAGRRLCVHRNTVRYRINRIQELCQTNFLDPVERLVMELQLALFSPDGIDPATSQRPA